MGLGLVTNTGELDPLTHELPASMAEVKFKMFPHHHYLILM